MTSPAPARSTPVIRSVHRSTGSREAATLVTSAQTAVGDVLVAIRAADWDTAAELGGPYGTAGTWRYVTVGDRGENMTKVQGWDRPVTVAGGQRVTVGCGDEADIALIVIVFDGSTLDSSWYEAWAGNTGASGTAHSAPNLSPAAAGGLFITMHATSDSGTTGKSTATYSTPAGMLSVLRQGSSPIAANTIYSGEYISLAVFSETRNTAGATGTRSATSSSSRPWATASLLFRGPVIPVPIEVDAPLLRARVTLQAAVTEIGGRTYDDAPPLRVRLSLQPAGVLEKDVDPSPLAVRATLADPGAEKDVPGVNPVRVTVRLLAPIIDNLTASPVRVRVGLIPGQIEFQAVTALTERRPRITTRPRKRIRFLAQRVLDRSWASKDVGIVDPTVTWKLNGPTEITGKIGAGELRALGVTTTDLFLHCEIDGNIRASTILDLESFSWGGPQIELTTSGPSAYLHKLTYEGDFNLRGETGVVGVKLDPLDVARHVWAHAQSWPDGKLGVVVSGTRSTARIGEPERTNTVATAPVATSGGATTAPPATGAPASPTGDLEQTTGPYILKWWEDSNLGKVIDDLAKSTPFDFRERPYWADSTRADVVQFIEFGWPRVGRIRDDLSFTEHQNLTRALAPVEHDDLFATDVYILGKGEGTARIRGRYGARVPGRLRRTAKVEKKDCTTTQMADAFARAEWPRRQGYISVDEIELKATHPNAPLGSFLVGDDVPARFKIQGVGQVQLRHRVTALAYVMDQSKLTATTQRSDTFSYGSSAATQ